MVAVTSAFLKRSRSECSPLDVASASRRIASRCCSCSAAPAGPIGGMLSAQYGAFAKTEAFRRLRERLASGVKTAQKKAAGRITSFQQALVAAEGADKARTRGQIRLPAPVFVYATGAKGGCERQAGDPWVITTTCATLLLWMQHLTIRFPLQVRTIADLLMSQLHLAKPGASSVELTDWEVRATAPIQI